MAQNKTSKNEVSTVGLSFDWSGTEESEIRPVNVFAMQRFQMSTVLTFGLAFPPAEVHNTDGDNDLQEYFAKGEPLKVKGAVRIVMAPDTVAMLARGLGDWVKQVKEQSND